MLSFFLGLVVGLLLGLVRSVPRARREVAAAVQKERNRCADIAVFASGFIRDADGQIICRGIATDILKGAP